MGIEAVASYRMECDRCFHSLAYGEAWDTQDQAERAALRHGWIERRPDYWLCDECCIEPEWHEQRRLCAVYGPAEAELLDLIRGEPATVARMVRERPRLRLCLEEVEALVNG